MHRRFFGPHLVILGLVGLGAIAVPVVAARLGGSGSSEGKLDPFEGELDPLTRAQAESADPKAVTPNGNMSVEEARAFSEFPLYWLDEVYEDLELTAIVRAKYVPEIGKAENSVTFLYGKCVITPGDDPLVQDNGGCAPPFQVIVQPLCLSRPGGSARDAGGLFQLRGAIAQRYTDGHLELGTGSVSVTLYGPDRELINAMAQTLRSVAGAGSGQAPVQAGAPLPPVQATAPLSPPNRPPNSFAAC
jgi:hypothetical protein